MGTTISSSDPGITLGNSKAVAGGVAGTLVAFLGGLGVAYADGAISGQEWVNIALATVLGAAAAFGLTWGVPTKVTLN